MRKRETDAAGLEILHLGDMFRLLATAAIGRVGFMADDEVAVLPVRFLIDGQDVVFRTYVGSKLSKIEVGHYACFEVDSYDAAARTGWSVVARGLVEKESEASCARLDAPGVESVESWGGTAQERMWMRIRPTSITGRRTPSPDSED